MTTQVAFIPNVNRMNTTPKQPISAPVVIGPSKVATKISRFRQPPPKPEIEVDKAQLKKQLTPLQYKVTQEKFTERFVQCCSVNDIIIMLDYFIIIDQITNKFVCEYY